MTYNVFVPSPLQAAIYEWIDNGQGSAIVEAVAGSGKTTTLVQGLARMVGTVFFGAYNRKIAEEIASKFRQLSDRTDVTVSTMHAAGFSAWRKVARNVKVDADKCKKIFRDASAKYPLYVPFEAAVLDLVSLAKQAAFGVESVPTLEQWNNLIDHFAIEIPVIDFNDEGSEQGRDLVIRLAKKVIQGSVSSARDVIDFDDMIFMPLYAKVNFWKYDWVLIDEAQDTNASRRLLALALLKKNGRLVAVGDKHQAIYGFTGADADALDLIKAATNAIALPLNVSYRCPKAVVTYAQRFVKHIEAHPEAIDGEVITIESTKLAESAQVNDAILCRFNAPLIKHAYGFIARGIAAKVEGREIGESLKKLARRWAAKTFDALLRHLDEYEEREVKKALAKEKPAVASAVEDAVICLKIIIDRVLKAGKEGVPSELVAAEVDMIFGENVRGPHVLLSTIHKSKGREWHNVFWLQAGHSKYAKQDWEVEQEVNLDYVATTRAQSKLILVDME